MTITLSTLREANWPVAFRTYGNDHSTLIGLIVSWWIGLDLATHEALDGGVSIPTSVMGGVAGRGHCDAVLLKSDRPVGVVEVEGTRYSDTLKKLRDFLNHIPEAEFGIFLAYRTTAQGRGKNRQVRPIAADVDSWLDDQTKILSLPAGKSIFVLGLEKEWTPMNDGVRIENDYYQCSPNLVWGFQLLEGCATNREMLSKRSDTW